MGYWKEGDCVACNMSPDIVGPLNAENICETCAKYLAKSDAKKAADKAFRDREPLVQAVIEAHKAYDAMIKNWQFGERGDRDRVETHIKLRDALDKLAGFQP